MIITLKGCTATAFIGGLNFFKVSRGTVSGATVTIATSTINKDEATSTSARQIATVVLNSNYENLVVTVTMGGTTVNWFANGKVTIPANTAVTGDIKISASATAVVPDEPVMPTMYTFTINPTPTTATVTLTASGYSQSGNSITVPANTSVAWKVSASGYTEQTGTHTVTKTESKSVSLNAASGDMYTYTVNATPKVANVTLSALGYNQSGNSITVADGTPVSWSVESLGYTTQSGTETITADKSTDIELVSANESQPVLTVYSTPRGKTIWTPTGGKKVNSNETGTFVGDTIGMKCYWGVTKDGYSPWGDVLQLNGNVNKECTLEALPMANVDRVLDTTTDMTKVTGYFFSTTTTKGSWNGYYSNFCFFQVPVTSGQKYQITTLTGQNAYPVVFLANAIDLSSYDLSGNPAGGTLTKIDIHSVGKKYAGPPTLGTYQVTVPDGVTAMIVQSQTSTTAMSAFKVELLK